jgi:hypothetical protein
MNISRYFENRHRDSLGNNTLNILTFPTHERYETQLAKTGHNFYSFHVNESKKWNKEQLPVPSNYYILPENNLCEYLNYDIILVQSKYWQFQAAHRINSALNLPIIVLEHTLPTPQTLKPEAIQQMRQMQGNVNVFISEYSQQAWGIEQGMVIHHGIDTETFKPTGSRGNHVLTVANDFKNRDYCLNYSGWERVIRGLDARVIGDNPGWTASAKSSEELAASYSNAGVYFNSTTISPIPTTLLEAMSCGCPVVSTATCMIPQIIEHGVNGLISNDEAKLRSYVELLTKDKELASKLGHNARETILNNFSEDRFVNQWNQLFQKVYEATR